MTGAIVIMKNPILCTLQIHLISPNPVSLKCFKFMVWPWETNSQSTIFRGDAHGRSFRLLIIFHGTILHFWSIVPLKTMNPTHCFVAVILPKHVQSVCSRLQKFNEKFYVNFCFHRRQQHTYAQKNTNFMTFKSKQNDVIQCTASWRPLLALNVHITVCCQMLASYRTSPITFSYYFVFKNRENKVVDELEEFNWAVKPLM